MAGSSKFTHLKAQTLSKFEPSLRLYQSTLWRQLDLDVLNAYPPAHPFGGALKRQTALGFFESSQAATLTTLIHRKLSIQYDEGHEIYHVCTYSNAADV